MVLIIRGRQIKKTKSIGKISKKTASKALAAFITEIETGQHIDNKKMTVSQYIDYWSKNYADMALKPKTRHRYSEIITTAIIPFFGHIQLVDIKPTHIQSWLANLRKPDMRRDGKRCSLNDQTIHHYYSLLRSLLNKAVRWGLLNMSPLAKIDPPKVAPREARFYDESQVQRLIKALKQASLKHQVLIHLTLATGCRLAEIAGLKWLNVDFESETVSILQTRQYIPGLGTVEGPPKSHHSKRTVSLDTELVCMLRLLKESQDIQARKLGTKWVNSGYVFINDFGQHLHPTSPSRWWYDFRHRHSLPELQFHGFRHTSGTLMLKNGVDLATVSRRLGHANVIITGKTYVHSTKESDKQAAEVLRRIRDKENTQTQ